MTTTWHGWFGLGGQITDAPSVVFPTPDTIDVYAHRRLSIYAVSNNSAANLKMVADVAMEAYE
jgi:hypothetical protein